MSVLSDLIDAYGDQCELVGGYYAKDQCTEGEKAREKANQILERIEYYLNEIKNRGDMIDNTCDICVYHFVNVANTDVCCRYPKTTETLSVGWCGEYKLDEDKLKEKREKEGK